MEVKSCSDINCPCQNPQPVSEFGKEKQSKDRLSYLCNTCRNIRQKARAKFRKLIKSLDNQDRKTVMCCLYVTGQESVLRLSKLFELSETQIEEVIESEGLLNYIICKTCGKLKQYSDYSASVAKTSSRKIQSDCKICVAKKHRDWGTETGRFSIYSIKLEKYESIRDNNGVLEVKCNYCGKWYKPLRYALDLRVNTIIGYAQKGFSENRLYCSDNCKSVCPVYKKQVNTLMMEDAIKAGRISPQELNREVQPELRQLTFARDNYTCYKCNKHQDQLCKGLHCHHIEGIRWNPLESADIDQCRTVCETCHIEVHKQPDCGYRDMRCNVDQMEMV